MHGVDFFVSQKRVVVAGAALDAHLVGELLCQRIVRFGNRRDLHIGLAADALHVNPPYESCSKYCCFEFAHEFFPKRLIYRKRRRFGNSGGPGCDRLIS